MLDKNNKRESLLSYNDSLFQRTSFKHFNGTEHNIPFKVKASTTEGYSASIPGSFKLFFWNNIVNYPETF